VDATHISGGLGVTFLLLSLALNAGTQLFDWMTVIQIRRRIGVAAALYALLHFLIYIIDQKWNLIVRRHRDRQTLLSHHRFHRPAGAHDACHHSTDGWQKRLKRNWKRLHWLIYPAAVLALVHFFIQSKVNVSEARWLPGCSSG